jgi:hypothetical protein
MPNLPSRASASECPCDYTCPVVVQCVRYQTLSAIMTCASTFMYLSFIQLN